MERRLVLAAGLLGMAVSSPGQDAPAVYQQEKIFRFRMDALLRQEWTQDIFVTAASTRDEDRQRFQARPGVEATLGSFRLGVGAEFNYSSDENDVGPNGATPAIIRDNYRSRDARVDLAFASYENSWIHAQGGRFEMPIGFTEMIWDRDLRPQGGAVTLGVKDRGAVKSAGVTGLWSRGSHVFEDKDTTMAVAAADVVFRTGETASLELMAAYVAFSGTDSLEPAIRRQNTRVAGVIVNDYDVVDLVARYRIGGSWPVQLVADYAWNTAVEQDNKGYWLAAVLGSIQSRPVRLEYTYADVDKDATLAAYPADDFFWETGWKGHRGDVGVRIIDHLSAHGVGHWVKFKASPRPEEREHVLKRFRIELRFLY